MLLLVLLFLNKFRIFLVVLISPNQVHQPNNIIYQLKDFPSYISKNSDLILNYLNLELSLWLSFG